MDNLNRYIDHTLLKPEATVDQIRVLCEEAVQHHFAAVCVNSCHVALAARLLSGSDTAACCVVGFPLGAALTSAKAFEAAEAAKAGAKEVDMVINIGAARDGEWAFVESDIHAVAKAAHENGAILKVIIECCLLNDDEKVEACLAAKRAQADFVKTSTGFSTGGATAADVKLMRETVGREMGVKAAGGIRDMAVALAMIEAGASRIGTSAGVKLMGK